MTTQAESKILTQTDPGTPMGELMRQYWLPALKSSELVADGDPVRFLLLGEKLIGFRDTSGRVGVMDHRCPHRCASFFFGRNEADGIICVYHGWKFDVNGDCTDMPNVAGNENFKRKVKAKAYKAAERNGVVWVYMGERQKAPPPLPDLESTLVPEDEMEILFILRECNWLQGAESELDTSHLGVLHFGAVDRSSFADDNITQFTVAERAPKYKYQETDFGTMYGAYRPGPKGETYWRIGHFLFPCWTMPPISPIGTNILARAYVPMDDENTMMVYWAHKKLELPGAKPGSKPLVGGGPWRFEPNTVDWLGRWRLKDNKANEYNIDREIQRTQSYTGITGINLQDQAVVESMGEITDHGFEHLAPSDIMITRTRRHLIRAARAYKKTGTLPKSALHPSVYDRVRGGQFVSPAGQDWLDAYAEKIADPALKAPPAAAAAE